MCQLLQNCTSKLYCKTLAPYCADDEKNKNADQPNNSNNNKKTRLQINQVFSSGAWWESERVYLGKKWFPHPLSLFTVPVGTPQNMVKCGKQIREIEYALELNMTLSWYIKEHLFFPVQTKSKCYKS